MRRGNGLEVFEFGGAGGEPYGEGAECHDEDEGEEKVAEAHLDGEGADDEVAAHFDNAEGLLDEADDETYS